MAKIATTAELIQINIRAKKKKFSKLLTPDLLERLDPEGIHVSTSVAVGQDYLVRVIWMLKLKGKEYPLEVLLDMTYKDYNSLRIWDEKTRLFKGSVLEED